VAPQQLCSDFAALACRTIGEECVTDDELDSLIGALDANLNAVYKLDPLRKKRGEWKNGERGSLP
jgi:hypothetical protein